MKDEYQESIRQRFDENFGINRLPMFASCILDLDKYGHSKTADALKLILKQELSGLQVEDMEADH